MKVELGSMANFLMVYIREAHASDEWSMKQNDEAGVSLAQPTTDEERCSVANTCITDMGITIPCVVDTVDDAVARPWGAWPERIYVLDESGTIVYQGGMGPFGFHPEEAEAFVRKHWGARQ